MKNIFKKIIIFIITVEAKLILKKYKPKIIAVTGSVGKTSTKDAIYSCLKDYISVRKNEKSFNSEIGVPLTILGVDNPWSDVFGWLSNIFVGLEYIIFKTKYPDWLVLEVGADHPMDIKKITSWLKPDIAIITKVGDIPVHVEFFPSPKDLLYEKAELIKGMKKNGIAILLNDEEKIANLPKDLNLGESHKDVKFLTFGIEKESDIRAKDINILYEDGLPSGMSFNIEVNEGGQANNSADTSGDSNNKENKNNYEVKIDGVIGLQHIYPVLVAVLVANNVGVDINNAIKFIANHVPPRGRMNIIEGMNESVIIDDTYNSSPDAVFLALNTIKDVNSSIINRKILVLGDMMELGRFSTDMHLEVGDRVAQLCTEQNQNIILITVGQRALSISESAIEGGMDKRRVFTYSTSREVGGVLRSMIQKGDLIFVKGSQSVRMERIVQSTMLNENMASELLVRQDDEWKRR